MANAVEAAALLGDRDFFCHSLSQGPELQVELAKNFSFPSPIVGSCTQSNQVYGTSVRVGNAWAGNPTVILLHGWNDEIGYRYRSPFLAKEFLKRGVNTIALELPFHLQRRPRQAGLPNDFISEDLWRTLEATRQCVGEVRMLVRWLKQQGAGPVGIWGISLGGWITSLIAAHDQNADAAVLMTPVVDMDRVVRELPFCEPLRRSLASSQLDLATLNPCHYSPKIPIDRLLLVQATYDLFAPAETIEQLWNKWEQPEIWRLPHGHISMLGSIPVMRRTVGWLAEKLHLPRGVTDLAGNAI